LLLDIVDRVADEAAAEIRIAAILHPDYGRRAPVAWFRDLLEMVAAGLDGISVEKDARGSSRTLSPAEDEGPLESREEAIRA
jgi:hypothetical protein